MAATATPGLPKVVTGLVSGISRPAAFADLGALASSFEAIEDLRNPGREAEFRDKMLRRSTVVRSIVVVMAFIEEQSLYPR